MALDETSIFLPLCGHRHFHPDGPCSACWPQKKQTIIIMMIAHESRGPPSHLREKRHRGVRDGLQPEQGPYKTSSVPKLIVFLAKCMCLVLFSPGGSSVSCRRRVRLLRKTGGAGGQGERWSSRSVSESANGIPRQGPISQVKCNRKVTLWWWETGGGGVGIHLDLPRHPPVSLFSLLPFSC